MFYSLFTLVNSDICLYMIIIFSLNMARKDSHARFDDARGVLHWPMKLILECRRQRLCTNNVIAISLLVLDDNADMSVTMSSCMDAWGHVLSLHTIADNVAGSERIFRPATMKHRPDRKRQYLHKHFKKFDASGKWRMHSTHFMAVVRIVGDPMRLLQDYIRAHSGCCLCMVVGFSFNVVLAVHHLCWYELYWHRNYTCIMLSMDVHVLYSTSKRQSLWQSCDRSVYRLGRYLLKVKNY